MSYILEALKKAQAERQLGHTPDIHAPAAVQLPPRAAPANRKPLLIGLGAGVLIAVLAGLAWRGGAPTQVQVPAQPAVQGQVSPAASAPLDTPVPVVSVADATPPPVAPPPEAPPAAARSEPGAAVVPVPAPAPPVPKAARPPSPRPAAAPNSAPQETVPQAVYLPAPARVAENPPVVRAPEPVPEESLRTLQQLPEAIQREVPKVAFGGYIYSPNPSDRLLLVDKVLRREGEELAPGLVLERLMPKYAVMNYRGTRYRVSY
ncbi:MAG: general secretion pathway protein GspB [Telluria sp.]